MANPLCAAAMNQPRGLTVIERLRMTKGLISADLLSQLLGQCKATTYKQAEQGILPSFRIGYTVKFDAAQIAQWLESKQHRN
jgi:predicted DNA-binding transcriptional regulator AlpA